MGGQILYTYLTTLFFLLKHVDVWFKLSPKTGLSDRLVKA